MAGARKPGPQCSFNHPVNVDDGTTYRAVSLPPGPLGAALDHDGVGHGSHTPGNASECVLGAYQRAIQVAPNAVYRETGYQLGEIPGLVPRLQALIAIFAPDVAQGGARGAANSALAVSDPGSDSGRAIFTSLGITFLQDFIGNGLDEMLIPLRKGIVTARHASECKGSEQARELDQATEELAFSIAILARLILQGIVAYRPKNPAASADEARAQLLVQLRSSSLSSAFAAWVDKNWKDLVKHPRLKARLSTRSLLDGSEDLQVQSSPPRSPKSEEEVRTWVAVRLVDSDGNPVPGQRYEIQLPDSSIEEGVLDADGSVRFNNILPGQCKIRFPDIHGKEWTPA